MHLPLIRIATAAAAALAVSVPAAVAAPANQATIDIDDQNMTANGFAAGSGWTRVTINADRPVDFGIVALKPGKDTGGFANAIGKLSPDRTESWGDWVAGGSTRPGAPYVVALDMDPAWYSVIVYERKKQYQVAASASPTAPAASRSRRRRARSACATSASTPPGRWTPAAR